MRRALVIAFGLSLAVGHAHAAPSHAKWMGQASCSAWPRQQAYDDYDKALLLNWVLGWLSRSGKDGADILARVDQVSVSGWLDRYCAAHPDETLISAAAKLEGGLTAQSRYSRL